MTAFFNWAPLYFLRPGLSLNLKSTDLAKTQALMLASLCTDYLWVSLGRPFRSEFHGCCAGHGALDDAVRISISLLMLGTARERALGSVCPFTGLRSPWLVPGSLF